MLPETAVTGQSSPSLEAEPLLLATCASGTGGHVTSLSAVLARGRKLVPRAGSWEERHLEVAAPQVLGPLQLGVWGWRWPGRGLGGEGKPIVPLD